MICIIPLQCAGCGSSRVREHRKAQAPENSAVRQVTFLDNNNNNNNNNPQYIYIYIHICRIMQMICILPLQRAGRVFYAASIAARKIAQVPHTRPSRATLLSTGRLVEKTLLCHTGLQLCIHINIHIDGCLNDCWTTLRIFVICLSFCWK